MYLELLAREQGRARQAAEVQDRVGLVEEDDEQEPAPGVFRHVVHKNQSCYGRIHVLCLQLPPTMCWRDNNWLSARTAGQDTPPTTSRSRGEWRGTALRPPFLPGTGHPKSTLVRDTCNYRQWVESQVTV